MKYRLTFDMELTDEDVQEAIEDFQRLLGIEPGSLPFEELAERDFRREFSGDEDMQRMVTNFSIRKVEEDEVNPASEFLHDTNDWPSRLAADRNEIVRALLDGAEIEMDALDEETQKLVRGMPDWHPVWAAVWDRTA